MKLCFIGGLLVTLLRVLSALKVDVEVKYEPTTETKAEIIAKYSTVNNDAEHIRAEQFAEKHQGDDDYLNLRKAAAATYEQVLPCIRSTWMMRDRDSDSFKGWRLPDDAEEHFEHLKNVTAQFREAPVHEYSGYEGPWIENIFIRDFIDKPLSYFNGFIPLFIQFIDMQILRGRHFDNIADLLDRELRAGVIYLAISQGDVGLGPIGTAHPNILVLAAGGYGHVPIPLVKGIKDYVEPPADFAYTNDLAFIGNMQQQGSCRPAMFEQLRAAVEEEKDDAKALSTFFSSYTDDWEKSMQDTRFNLAPRGYGRSSFRFSEIIQMGRVPVFLWDDSPWIPYQGTAIGIETYGFQCGLHEQKEQVVPPDALQNYYDFKHKVKAVEVDVSLSTCPACFHHLTPVHGVL